MVGLARTPGHDDRLRSLLRSRHYRPFEWGTNDCCLFAADAVKAQLGHDPAEALRGRYATQMQAARVLLSFGGIESIARQALGEPLRAPMLACTGDVGLLDEAGRKMLAVCLGDWWTAPTERGLGLMPLQSAISAWRVGCG